MAFELYQLKVWQNVVIDGVPYKVKSMIEFCQGNYFWKEYELESPSSQHFRLSVDRDERITFCDFSQVVEDRFVFGESQMYGGEKYVRVDSGSASVVSVFGQAHAREGDTLEFAEYRTGSNLFLSRQQWADSLLCTAGKEIPQSKVNTDDGPFTQPSAVVPSFSANTVYKQLQELQINQQLKIKDKTYKVTGSVLCKQGNYRWREYEIVDDSHKSVWLSVELNGAEGYPVSLHSTCTSWSEVSLNDSSATYRGTVFQLIDKGKAKVVSYEGRGDYDDGEVFTFTEYRSPDGEILSCEYWEDEKEFSVGRDVELGDVTVFKAPARSASRSSSSRSTRGRVLSFVIPFGLVVLFSILFWRNPPLAKQIASHSQFKNVTSVTLDKNVKAEVYSTVLSPEEACRTIINMSPDEIQYVTRSVEDTQKNELMLRTTKEIVMIYPSETGETHVQVSKEGVPDEKFTTYRPRSSLRTYNLYRQSRAWQRNTDTTLNPREAYGLDTDEYNATIATARANSARSRGGSTGFGK